MSETIKWHGLELPPLQTEDGEFFCLETPRYRLIVGRAKGVETWSAKVKLESGPSAEANGHFSPELALDEACVRCSAAWESVKEGAEALFGKKER